MLEPDSKQSPPDPAPTHLLPRLGGSPALHYKGLSRIAKLPACVISVDDLRRLYLELDKKAQEALERFLSTIQRPADTTEADFEGLKEQARDVGHVTVAVQGKHGEQIVHTSIDALDADNLPESVTSIIFDSTAALQFYNVNITNRVQLRIDFTEPPAFARYDPWNQPTPNNSQLEVSGPDDTWVTAVYQSTLDFFERRRKARDWLHGHEAFNLLNWFLGIPASLWIVYRLDSQLIRWFTEIPGALRGAIDVYFFLVGMLGFRGMIYGLRWMFPLIELEGARSKTARRSIGFVIGGLFVALLYDVLKTILL